MKHIPYLLLSLIFSSVYGQSPQTIPYQAVARNNAGDLINNQLVSLRFTIHDISANGTIVYKETQSTTTNALGLFTVNVGQGTVLIGAFNGINWGAGAKFLQVELDPTGNANYTDMGTQQMMSVPYALFANKSISHSGSSWQAPDSPNQSNNQLVAVNVSNSTSYVVPAGKRLYIYSIYTGGGQSLLLDGLQIAANQWQNVANVNALSLGNPILVDQSKTITADASIHIIGYLVDNPTPLITPVLRQVNGVGTSYVVPVGKMFVLLNAFTSFYKLVVVPNGGDEIAIGETPNSSRCWVLNQPMFLYPGDAIRMATGQPGNGTINGYEVEIGTQF